MNSPAWPTAALFRLRHRITRSVFRAGCRVARELGYAVTEVGDLFGISVPSALRRPDSATPSEIYEMRALLPQRGCAICRRGDESLQRFTVWFFLETYGEGPFILVMMESGGFCPDHFWMMARSQLRYPLSFVAQYLAQHDLRRLNRVRAAALNSQQWSAAKLAALKRTRRCPACHLWDGSARYGVQQLLRALSDGVVRSLWRQSDGLCWRHLQLAVAAADESTLRLVLEVQRERMEDLLESHGADFERRSACTLSGWGDR